MSTPRERWNSFARIGLLSFGGPAGQIAVMHRELVERRGWLDEARFLHALAYCMLLPGPEAQQLATFGGWVVGGWRWAVLAGCLFVLPGVLALLACSLLYVLAGDQALVQGIFAGLQPAVLAVVVAACLRIGAKALADRPRVLIAAAAFVGLAAFQAPFPLVLLAAGLAGWLCRHQLRLRDEAPETPRSRPSWRRTAATALLWLALWAAPGLLCLVVFGPSHVLTVLAFFFAWTAAISFGGAYALLAYLAQQAVAVHGWLQASEMLDGLGLAESTPGPLIMVVQFVAFLAGFRDPAPFGPILGGIVASLLVVWMTFAPSFLWILSGAPWIEHLRGRRGLAAVMAGVQAAVCGIIASLALWFAIHAGFTEQRDWAWGPLRMDLPDLLSAKPVALLVAVAAGLALIRFRIGLGWVLGLAAGLGGVLHLFGLPL